ncbi:hypothetical protein HY408_02100 [Candidatus Gottesmanbacteria bacterium]|nr:hypothetical protein [Candidatus Gottesmanbacteria bacterium]
MKLFFLRMASFQTASSKKTLLLWSDVGFSRAACKKILYLTYASRRLYFGEKVSNPPSRFIIDIPENLIESPNGELRHLHENEEAGTFDDIVEKYLRKQNELN